MEIVKLSSYTLKNMNKCNEALKIIGKLKPTFVNGNWTYTEELYAQSYLHSYPNFKVMEVIMNRESFACSMWYHGIGILGGYLLLDSTTLTYTIQRQRRDIPEQYWNLVLPLNEIEEIKWKRILFPLAIFRMKNQEEYRLFIFNKRRFNTYYLSRFRV